MSDVTRASAQDALARLPLATFVAGWRAIVGESHAAAVSSVGVQAANRWTTPLGSAASSYLVEMREEIGGVLLDPHGPGPLQFVSAVAARQQANS